MNYWMFSVTSHKEDGKIFNPEEILTQRFSDRLWGLGEKTPNRKALQPGDKIVFYLGNPHKAFAASAVLGSAMFTLSPAEQKEFAHDTDFFRTTYGVRLEQPVKWEHPHRVEDLLPSLGFIENKEYWGSYFQGGVRQLGERDFEIICENVIPAASTLTANVPASASPVSAAEFALESHLEEFMDRNWHHISFGKKLKRYRIDEQSGRQFPAGQWSIDFLCVDEEKKCLVVIELKKGQTSDATVGQILRYISWVRENIAEKGQAVEGIIIAREVDQALQYALKDQPHITVLTYRVDFTLQKPER